jgi:DNA-binding beta-propeller fold protein YncE
MKLQIMICLFSNLLFFGCDKGPDLTPITQEGKNTFSCKVNGKVWVPDATGSIFVTVKPINGGFYKNALNGTRNIEIRAYKANQESIVLFLRTIDLGRHQLNQKTLLSGESFYPENYGYYFTNAKGGFVTSNQNTGWINISKADTATGIIAGTFEFVANNLNGETISIADGRFDIDSPL